MTVIFLGEFIPPCSQKIPHAKTDKEWQDRNKRPVCRAIASFNPGQGETRIGVSPTICRQIREAGNCLHRLT